MVLVAQEAPRPRWVDTISLKRSTLTLVLALTVSVTFCTRSPPVITEPPPASAEEVEIFCQRYDEVRDWSRHEVLALLDVTPEVTFDAVKRASERNGSFEDDAAIDVFIDRCGGP